MKPLAQNTLIQNRYLIVHLIGKGGMGEVYLAVDQRLGSAVALKRTFFAGDEMLGNAFEREARTLARMRHPVLPKVSDHFGENDEQYLVMEHISGDDLAKRLDAAGKPFPVSWVLFWADQLLDALSYLHTHEPPIIHRDIKPQNLKLTDENHVILLDFGLSKTSTGQTNISQAGSTGSVVGYTPHYAPMEQIRGIGTSPRSDLYSLSATLYQLMTNVIPVDALTRADAMLNEMPDPIRPPTEYNPEVPKVVSEVILRGMEVSQEKRFANAREMQRVLRKAFNELHQATTANTVAFTAEEARAIIPTPEASAAGPSGSRTGKGGPPSVSEQEAVDSPAIAPDRSIDLNATMAVDPPLTDSSLRQADVKTEVFLTGTNSFPQPVPEIAPPPSAAREPFADSQPRPGSSNSESAAGRSGGDSYSAGATVPFIALDQPGDGAAEAPLTTDFAGAREPEFFEQEAPADTSSAQPEIPYFQPSEPEPEVAAEPFAPQPQTAAQPARKSSGRMIAVIGGLAALLLLAVVVAGGIWAFVNYGPGAAAGVNPSPSPEETVFETLPPEPTIESGINADTGNSNVDGASTPDDNSNSGIIVDPTPDRTPSAEPTPGTTRPTPRTGGTPRSSTPGTRPTPQTRKPPVPTRTVMP